MRIAVLAAARSIHTIKWVKSLAKKGHTVALFSLPDHKAPEGALNGIETHYLKIASVLGYWLCSGELSKLLKEFAPDVLNAHYASGYGMLARRCGFKPLLLSVWGSDVYDFPNQGGFNRRLLIKNLQSATAIASTSNVMAVRVKNLLREQKDIFITPFGVDTKLFDKCNEPQKDMLTVGIVKALEPKYGVEYLIRGFSLFKRRLEKEGTMPPRGIRLEIFGTGSLMPELKELAISLDLEDLVHFHGAVPHSEVPKIISGFDIFCAPSISDSESFGVAAVEAMACGVPVVVSNADGFREVVKDQKTGFIVTRKDPVLLANKLFVLANDAELRRKMGEEGRRHVQANYEWNDCVAVMENALYDTISISKTVKNGEQS